MPKGRVYVQRGEGGGVGGVCVSNAGKASGCFNFSLKTG